MGTLVWGNVFFTTGIASRPSLLYDTVGVEIGSAAAAAAAAAKLESDKSICFFSTARRLVEPETGFAEIETVDVDIWGKNSEENPRN